MTDLENGENSSGPTLKKQPVRLVNLIQTDKDNEELKQSKDKMCCVCMIIVCSTSVLQKVIV